PAVLVVGGLICAGVLVGDVRVTWSFSAFSVLVYYGITNAAALRLPAAARRYPRAIAWAGLLACALLAFMVEPAVWLTGLGMIGAGMIWRYGSHHFAVRKPQSPDVATDPRGGRTTPWPPGGVAPP